MGMEGFEGYDHKESLLAPDLQEELDTLRKAQIDGGESWTEDKRQRFLELSALEDAAKAERLKQG